MALVNQSAVNLRLTSDMSRKYPPEYPPPRLTWQALILVATVLSVPVALVLWGIEALM
jgi:hypothetical protein